MESSPAQATDAGHTEQFVLSFHQHWIRILPRMLRLLLQQLIVLAAGFVTFGYLDLGDSDSRRAVIILFIVAFLLTQFEFIVVLYRFFLRITVITDRKIYRFKKTILLIDEHHTIDLWMIQDVRKNQHGFIQNMLGFGSLVLDAQESQLRLHFVPRVQEKADLLLRLRERAREHMTWGKEGIYQRA